MRYFISLAYNGTRFHGWQIQPNAPSVQACIQENLSKLFGYEIQIVGVGRTDTGVHASCFFAHFDTDLMFDSQDVCYRLNKMLPYDIVIFNVKPVSADMHARFSVEWRTYVYTITRVKNPFLAETAWYFPFELDVDAMNHAAQVLLQVNDFTSFSKLHTDVKTNICNVTYAHWHSEDDLLFFTITANRFLRNMVRAITGTLLEVGKHKITYDEFCAIIASKNRSNAGQSIPAHGLNLSKITYPISL